jgi:hypothetical protein
VVMVGEFQQDFNRVRIAKRLNALSGVARALTFLRNPNCCRRRDEWIG